MFFSLIFGKTVAGIVASTQLYGFAAFGDPLGSLSSQGERSYFLLAIIAVSVALISSGLLFYFYYARKKRAVQSIGRSCGVSVYSCWRQLIPQLTDTRPV